MGSGVEQAAVGIVVERRAIANRWRPWSWRVMEIVPDLPGGTAWRRLMQGDDWVRYAAAGIMVELHPKQTEDYKYALSAYPPQLYVVLRAAQQEPVPFQPFLVTASPWEAQAYQEPGDDMVESLPMPTVLAAWLEAFVDRHDVERPFFKRRRKGLDKVAGEGSDFVQLGVGGPDDRN